MIDLKPSEAQALQVIQRWQERLRNSPNTPELARELGWDVQAAGYALDRLEDMGYLWYFETTSRRRLIVPLWWE